jgi:hypothetical protein
MVPRPNHFGDERQGFYLAWMDLTKDTNTGIYTNAVQSGAA